MNLQKVQVAEDGPAVTVFCQGCEKLQPAEHCFADLDGAPYATYYCYACLPYGEPCSCVTYGLTCREHGEALPYWHR